MSVISESVTDMLKPPALAYVATIGPAGEPQVSPVIFAWDGELIRFGMNVIRQKRRNLERDPRIALSITDPSDPFRTVEIRGIVLRIEEDEHYEFHRFISRLYFGDDGRRSLLADERRVVAVVQPERLFTFAGTPPHSNP